MRIRLDRVLVKMFGGKLPYKRSRRLIMDGLVGVNNRTVDIPWYELRGGLHYIRVGKATYRISIKVGKIKQCKRIR